MNTKAREEGGKEALWAPQQRIDPLQAAEGRTRADICTAASGGHHIWIFPEGGVAHREYRLEETKGVRMKQWQRGAVVD